MAALAPSLTMYTSMWYTRAESTPRYGFWSCGLGVGQIVGGLISFAAQHAPTDMSFGGWRIMFVAIGMSMSWFPSLCKVRSKLPSMDPDHVFYRIYLLPDSPENAKLLAETEKLRIAQRLVN